MRRLCAGCELRSEGSVIVRRSDASSFADTAGVTTDLATVCVIHAGPTAAHAGAASPPWSVGGAPVGNVPCERARKGRVGK